MLLLRARSAKGRCAVCHAAHIAAAPCARGSFQGCPPERERGQYSQSGTTAKGEHDDDICTRWALSVWFGTAGGVGVHVVQGHQGLQYFPRGAIPRLFVGPKAG